MTTQSRTRDTEPPTKYPHALERSSASQHFGDKEESSRPDELLESPPADENLPTRGINGRKRTSLACHECRYRKVKCDGVKPICGSCRRRGRQFTCSYRISREKEKARNIYGYVDRLEKTIFDLTQGSEEKRRQLPSNKSPSLIRNGEIQSFAQSSPPSATLMTTCDNVSVSGARDVDSILGYAGSSIQCERTMSSGLSLPEASSENDRSPAKHVYDSSSTDHFMEKVHMVTIITEQASSPPLHDRSVSGISGYFRDSFEEQIAKKPSILTRDDDCKNTKSRQTMQVLLAAYWDRVHILHPYLHRPTWYGKQKAESLIRGSRTPLDPSSDSVMAVTMVNLVFALGALYSPTFKTEDALTTSERFFLCAKEALTLDRLETPSLELAQNLLLMTQYSIERCNHQRGHLHASLLYLSLAIRVCTALGLHKDAGADQGPLIREIYRRVWWECIYTDITLATHYGQHLLLHQFDQVPPPLPIADELIFGDHIETHDAAGLSKTAFFVKAIQLVQILRDIKDQLYGNRRDDFRSHPTAYDTGDLRALTSLRARLLDWHAALPPELTYPSTSTTTSKHFRYQATCLYLRYQYASMLIYRPALSSLLEAHSKCMRSEHPARASTGDTEHPMLLLQHARSCIAVAVDFIRNIYALASSRDQFSIFRGHSWTLFYLYSMIAVLIATKCCREELNSQEEFREAWKQVTNILRNYRSSSNLVEIPFRFLEYMGRQYIDNPNEQQLLQSSISRPYCSDAHVDISGEKPQDMISEPIISTSDHAANPWESSWSSIMDDKTFELLADPWEAWDLQWLA